MNKQGKFQLKTRCKYKYYLKGSSISPCRASEARMSARVLMSAWFYWKNNVWYNNVLVPLYPRMIYSYVLRIHVRPYEYSTVRVYYCTRLYKNTSTIYIRTNCTVHSTYSRKNDNPSSRILKSFIQLKSSRSSNYKNRNIKNSRRDVNFKINKLL